MPDTDLIERELRQAYPRPSTAATAHARAEVMRTSIEPLQLAYAFSAPAGWSERPRWRPVLVAAVVVAALIGVGVAIAAGFGAFSGISATQRPQTPADKIDPKLLAAINAANSVRGGPGRLIPGSARLVRRLSHARIYAVATKDGQLCVLAERLLNNNGKYDSAGMGCGSPLTQSQPSTAATFARNESSPAISWGIALDSVAAVSFTSGDQEVTVPVVNNVWAYEGQAPVHGSITAHLRDGSTEPIG